MHQQVHDPSREVEHGLIYTNKSVPVDARVNSVGNTIPFMCLNINGIGDIFGDPDVHGMIESHVVIVLLQAIKD